MKWSSNEGRKIHNIVQLYHKALCIYHFGDFDDLRKQIMVPDGNGESILEYVGRREVRKE
jgi:hypothetical protein